MKKCLLLLIIILSLTGCFLDPYKNTSFAEDAVNSWFSYVNGDEDIGSSRKKIENIATLKGVSCDYIKNDKNLNYIYKCDINYSPIGETIIPLSKDEKKSMYVALTYHEDRSYNYIVYNSIYTDKPWINDITLNYGK